MKGFRSVSLPGFFCTDVRGFALCHIFFSVAVHGVHASVVMKTSVMKGLYIYSQDPRCLPLRLQRLFTISDWLVTLMNHGESVHEGILCKAVAGMTY